MSKYIWEDRFVGVELKVETKSKFELKMCFLRNLKKLWHKLIGRKKVSPTYVHVQPRILGDCCSLLDNPATKPQEQVWDEPETATSLNFVRPDLRYLASDRLDSQGYWQARKCELMNGLEQKAKKMAQQEVKIFYT